MVFTRKDGNFPLLCEPTGGYHQKRPSIKWNIAGGRLCISLYIPFGKRGKVYPQPAMLGFEHAGRSRIFSRFQPSSICRNPSGTDMGVSKNNGTPKSSILIGFSIINHPFWGTPIFGNIHIGNSLDALGFDALSVSRDFQ